MVYDKAALKKASDCLCFSHLQVANSKPIQVLLPELLAALLKKTMQVCFHQVSGEKSARNFNAPH
jgi:adenosylmethionine-8-amino-7-oxononanoate aminotransferase